MRIVLFVIALAASVPASAQLQYQVTPALTYGAKDTTKKQRDFPIFWSAARKVFPPLPFNPFPELTVYDAGNNNLIYDDREVDYPALEAALAKERAQAEAEAAALAKDADGGGMALRLSSSSTNLTLATPVFDGTNLSLTIENGVAGEFYDLFYSTNLVDWLFHVRTDLDQFSFSITPPAWPVCFLRLGTQQDTDDDTLTDAYEALITQTSPTFPNTLQNLNLYTNLTAAQFATLSNNLIDHLPVLEMDEYERDYSDVFLNSACAFAPGNSFDGYSEHTRWTNGFGGFFTNSLLKKYCVNGAEVSTNHQREGRIAADALGTNYYRSRVDSGAWSAWEEEWYGAVPRPGALLNDTSRRRNVHVRTNGTTPLETYRVMDTTTATMHYRTRGLLFSQAVRRHKITVSATDYGTPGGTNVPPHLIRFESLNGQPYADSNGVLYVTLRDNWTNYLTPKLPAQFTNYTYYVSAERHEVPLTFHTIGELTARETTNNLGQLVGYSATIYDAFTNTVETRVLGPGFQSYNGQFHQLCETLATVPVNSTQNGFWRWHRDRQRSIFFWRPDSPSNVVLAVTNQLFTPGPAGQGFGNDTGGGAADEIPDANGLIMIADTPAIAPAPLSGVTAPPGSIYAFRFYAREWVTWNGLRSSGILRWRVFITLRRKADLTWERVAPDFVEEIPAGHSEEPAFTAQDAQQASQQ